MELAEAHISYPRHKSNSLAGLSLILLAHRTFYISLIKFNSHLTIYKEQKEKRKEKLGNKETKKKRERKCAQLRGKNSDQVILMHNDSLYKIAMHKDLPLLRTDGWSCHLFQHWHIRGGKVPVISPSILHRCHQSNGSPAVQQQPAISLCLSLCLTLTHLHTHEHIYIQN